MDDNYDRIFSFPLNVHEESTLRVFKIGLLDLGASLDLRL